MTSFVSLVGPMLASCWQEVPLKLPSFDRRKAQLQSLAPLRRSKGSQTSQLQCLALLYLHNRSSAVYPSTRTGLTSDPLPHIWASHIWASHIWEDASVLPAGCGRGMEGNASEQGLAQVCECPILRGNLSYAHHSFLHFIFVGTETYIGSQSR